ncbi:hypothetical protein B0H14DRAFT_1513707 [Mycena olivaceomarginata]|nr:hypothetical protein B0H14DRAFT_1513707 [Mycena olivaceomarginata]
MSALVPRERLGPMDVLIWADEMHLLRVHPPLHYVALHRRWLRLEHMPFGIVASCTQTPAARMLGDCASLTAGRRVGQVVVPIVGQRGDAPDCVLRSRISSHICKGTSVSFPLGEKPSYLQVSRYTLISLAALPLLPTPLPVCNMNPPQIDLGAAHNDQRRAWRDLSP